MSTPHRKMRAATAVIILIKEKALLEEVADLAERVVDGRGTSGGYQKGLTPSQQLHQKLIDLRILQARYPDG